MHIGAEVMRGEGALPEVVGTLRPPETGAGNVTPLGRRRNTGYTEVSDSSDCCHLPEALFDVVSVLVC